MSRYKWVWQVRGEKVDKLYDVGILADGTLYNPRGYPEDEVRAAVLAADAQCRELRSQAAKKAGETRRRRREKKINTIAQMDANKIGPRGNCYICGRGLGDPESIARGIGSECWQDVLKLIERISDTRQGGGVS
jgi:hypothetical protein